MKVLELQPAKRVLWQVVDGPAGWIGTKISWELKQEGDYAIVLFKHQGWKEPVEFMHHCSTKWAIFLMSLKSLVETGKGAPNPNDIKIDNGLSTTMKAACGRVQRIYERRSSSADIDKVFKALADPTPQASARPAASRERPDAHGTL